MECLGEIFSGDADEEGHLEMGWKLRVSGRDLLLMINSFPHEMEQFLYSICFGLITPYIWADVEAGI